MSENITSLLSKSACYCLNEDPRASHQNLFMGDASLPLCSDSDEQLLLHLAFGQTVKISTIEIGVPNNDSCPRTLKLFCNQNNIGFSEASGMIMIKSSNKNPLSYDTIASGYTSMTANMMFDDIRLINLSLNVSNFVNTWIDLAPLQTITIEPGQAVVKLSLQAVKWQRVESISIFVEDNHGSDVTTLHSLRIYGQSVMSTNVADIKAVGHEH